MSTAVRRRSLPLAAASLVFFATSCGDAQRSGAAATASVATAPFVALPHQGGEARELKLRRVSWGRLVDVYSRSGAADERVLVLRDVLVGESIGDAPSGEFELELGLDGRTAALTILHPHGSTAFDAALEHAQAACGVIESRGLERDALPPFSRVPRNAVVALDFDDLLDVASIDSEALGLFTGERFDEPLRTRVWAAPSHGGLRDGALHPTRVLVDARVERDGLGLPAAQSVARANLALRLRTRATERKATDGVLRNLRGATLSGDGDVDVHSKTRDIVRIFRSGGSAAATGDHFAGMLADTTPPRVLLELDSRLTGVRQPAGIPADQFDVVLRFDDPRCRVRRRVGDLIETATHVAHVVSVAATHARVQVLQGTPATFGVGPARYVTPYTPSAVQPVGCALRFTPAAGSIPLDDVSVNASFRLRFSEPIDPKSVSPFEALRVRRPAPLSSFDTFVVGEISADATLTSFTFQPRLPFAHTQGVAESYVVELDGARITDLAGNALADDLPDLTFKLAATQPSQANAGIVLRFNGTDEDGDGLAEVRGQVMYDIALGVLRPRAVARFSAAADSSAPIVGAMTPLSVGVRDPLNPLGARSMNVWRYCDLNLGLLDETTHNLDIEGLWWQPAGGVLTTDNFTHFRMALAHSRYLPDENLGGGLLPEFALSGLVAAFDANQLSASADPLTVVHDKSRGYPIAPAQAVTTPSGAVIAPYPLNRGIALSDFSYWTWRDTAKLELGGPNGAGADPRRLQAVTPPGAAKVSFYPVNKAPTIGLPLLTEIRTYPDVQATGVNSFSVAIALNISARPYFRTFSSGGVNPITGAVKIVDPDQSNVANGGVNPQNGFPTPFGDNRFYYGEADFVVRISRCHTRWLDTQSSQTVFATPLLTLEASPGPGASAVLAFRGASALTNTLPTTWRDAARYDSYGNAYTSQQSLALNLPATSFVPLFFPNSSDASWRTNLSSLDGARFVQVRMSFLANATTGATTAVDSLALAYRR